VDECLELTGLAIVIAAWLAAAARRELARFAEFITFLRSGTGGSSAVSVGANCFPNCLSLEAAQYNRPQGEPHQVVPPRHDILEVNEFLMSGLIVSSIDRWFIGPVPQFSMQHLTGVPQPTTLHSVMEQARQLTDDPSKLTWPPVIRPHSMYIVA
jgi:anaphase-promoting complex subunit 4